MTKSSLMQRGVFYYMVFATKKRALNALQRVWVNPRQIAIFPP